MSIEGCDVSKRWTRVIGLDKVSVPVETGELIALLGPSGSGKTTLLRIIAGLESADSGSVYFGGEDATEARVRDRGVGFVFQHYALFKHMNVSDNIAFGLRVMPKDRRPNEAQIKAKAEQLLHLVQLEGMGPRFPAQLTGGQRQRVALARALAVDPAVLLLDEPFGALDNQVRHELRRWLRRLHDELHFTSVFVTHDQQEASEVADSIVLLNRGRIEQSGVPEEVYDRPASAFVHRFLGETNELPLHVSQGRLLAGPLDLSPAPDSGLAPGSVALVRPHEVELDAPGSGGGAAITD